MSLPLVALAGAATGVVLSLEARYSLTRFGAKSLLPSAIVFSIPFAEFKWRGYTSPHNLPEKYSQAAKPLEKLADHTLTVAHSR